MSREPESHDETRELRERLQGALADVEVLKGRLVEALEAKVLIEESLASQTNRVRQLEAEKRLMWEKVSDF